LSHENLPANNIFRCFCRKIYTDDRSSNGPGIARDNGLQGSDDLSGCHQRGDHGMGSVGMAAPAGISGLLCRPYISSIGKRSKRLSSIMA